MSERDMSWGDRLARIQAERSAIEAFDVDRPLDVGLLTPRQRVHALLDEGSFLEIGAFSQSQHEGVQGAPADGVITGFGTIRGRDVCILSEDPRALAVTDAQVAKAKRLRLLDQAVYKGLPVIYLADGSPTPYPQFTPGSGMMHLRLADQRSARDVADRTAPLISVILGVCRGQDASLAVASDLIVATPAGKLSLTEQGAEGAPAVDVVASDDANALAVASAFLGLVPESTTARLTSVGRAAGPAGALDDEDMTTEPGRLVAGLFDDDSAIVFGPRSGPVNAGIAAVEGVPVIFIITGGAQPTSLTAADLIRIARATAISRRFSLPLVVVQDCAGYGPDPDAMSVQLARHVLEDLRASAAIKLSIVAGRGFVLGDFVLGGRGAGYDLIWAWPSASIPVADVRAYDAGAAAPAPDGPWAAADIRIVDDVILPSETRRWLSRALTVLAGSRAVPPTAYDRGAKLVDLA